MRRNAEGYRVVLVVACLATLALLALLARTIEGNAARWCASHPVECANAREGSR